MESLPCPPPATERQLTLGSSPIFRNFNSYYEALCESLNTEFYGKTYPDYQYILYNGGKDVDIVEQLLACDESSPAQEAFDNFFKTILKGTRYARDFLSYGSGKEIIKLFLERGAVVKWDIIFNYFPEGDLTEKELNMPPRNKYEFEDYNLYSHVRAMIIDVLVELEQPVDDEATGIKNLEAVEFPENVSIRTGHLQMIKFYSEHYSQYVTNCYR